MSTSNTNAAHRGPFPLMSLPREIRDGVYRELLIPEKLRGLHEDPKSEYILEPAILRTSKQINAEASPVLYHENIWIMYTSNVGCDWRTAKDDCRIFTSNLESFPSPFAIQVDQRLIGEPYGYKPMEDGRLDKYLMASCDLWRLPRIASRTNPGYLSNYNVNIHIDPILYSRSLDEDTLLDPFRDIRGVNHVHLTGAYPMSIYEKLEALITRPVRYDDLLERINYLQKCGDQKKASRQIRAAKDLYSHGVEILQAKPSLDYDSNQRQILWFKTISFLFDCVVCDILMVIPLSGSLAQVGLNLRGYIEAIFRCRAVAEKLGEEKYRLFAATSYNALKLIIRALRSIPDKDRIEEEIDTIETRLLAAGLEGKSAPEYKGASVVESPGSCMGAESPTTASQAG